jgi:hypothetical protein
LPLLLALLETTCNLSIAAAPAAAVFSWLLLLLLQVDSEMNILRGERDQAKDIIDDLQKKLQAVTAVLNDYDLERQVSSVTCYLCYATCIHAVGLRDVTAVAAGDDVRLEFSVAVFLLVRRAWGAGCASVYA